MGEILNYLADRVGIVSLLTGIVFIAGGLVMYKFPPKKINYLYGYRTNSSMKNEQVWDFSQKFSAVKMVQVGILLLATSFLNMFFDISQEQSVFVGIGLMVLGCFYMCTVTEKAIKKNFPND
jgi:uncharacterized membrane protein